MSRALALVDSSTESRKYESAHVAGAPRLLETKLYVPRSRPSVVPRPRLAALMHPPETQKLVLVAAPAGFGKTTLVAECLGASTRVERTAWVSLDATDNDPRQFWAYVVGALQRAHGLLGTEALGFLYSPEGASIEAVLTSFINEITAADADLVLVLDDYHVIDEPAIHTALTFFLDHLPPRLRLVIATRSEPPIALGRLRARGELAELHARDLRFTLDETTAFLNQAMGLGLSQNDLRTLEQQTEGWIAGLKLAALSMKGRGDSRRFVETFSGEHRHVTDYLVEEVLAAEPPGVQRFLLATCILDRLSGALCDAVTGGTGSQSMLEDLERRNLFIVPLDDRREWYRYHHLFADVLQKQSSARDADVARSCHARASAWCEERGAVAEAVRHALAAGAIERAASLLERSWPEKDRSYESARWLSRVRTLPESVVRSRPVLSMGYAWALLNSGELEVAEQWLHTVDQTLQGDRTSFVVGDEHRFESLPMELASARIYLTQSLGDVPGTLEHATRALEQIPTGDHAARATGMALVALALWGRGELDHAHGTFSDALTAMRAAGHDLDALRGMFVLGDIRSAQGRLREAAAAYQRGLDLVSGSARLAGAETDELHLGMSEVRREWNDLASAVTHLDAIRERASAVAHKGNMQRWCIAMARVREARGDLHGALDLLAEAEQHDRRDPVPRTRSIAALRTRVRIVQGKLGDATRWVEQAGLTTDDELSYLREFEHFTLARLLIAQRSNLATHVLPLLDRLRASAQTGGRSGSVIESLVLQSLAQHALGSVRGALDSLAAALALAEAEGYVRLFLDEGDAMRELLRTATARGLAGAYTRRVLVAFDAPDQPIIAPAVTRTATPAIQSLTARELEILRLIAAGLRNQEIADHLAISGATVKRHIANAYAKLGAGHRTEALARAAELKLL